MAHPCNTLGAQQMESIRLKNQNPEWHPCDSTTKYWVVFAYNKALNVAWKNTARGTSEVSILPEQLCSFLPGLHSAFFCKLNILKDTVIVSLFLHLPSSDGIHLIVAMWLKFCTVWAKCRLNAVRTNLSEPSTPTQLTTLALEEWETRKT